MSQISYDLPDIDNLSEYEAEATKTESQAKCPPLTSLEKNFLLELIDKRKSILECKKTDFGTIVKKKDEWNKVSKIFNCESGFYKRSGEQLKIWWNNSKRTAKGKVSLYKKAVKKTGGGKNEVSISAEVEKIVSIVPMQMKSLENPYDCDGPSDIFNEIQETHDDPLKAIDTISSKIQEKVETVENTLKRKACDARSSLVDMEYEEHKIRLKILKNDAETSETKRKTAKLEFETAEIMKKREELRLKMMEIEFDEKYTK